MPVLGQSFGFAFDLGVREIAWVDECIPVAPQTDAVFVVGGVKMRTIYITQGDRLPPIQALAFNENKRVPLDQFESITFRMVSGSTEIEGVATGTADGELEYDLAAGDTDVLGDYDAVFIGTDAEGRIQTIPTPNRLKVVIVAPV